MTIGRKPKQRRYHHTVGTEFRSKIKRKVALVINGICFILLEEPIVY